jgi:hypothetical protein
MVIVMIVKDNDPVQLRMDDIYDHSFVSTIQHHVHHISNRMKGGQVLSDLTQYRLAKLKLDFPLFIPNLKRVASPKRHFSPLFISNSSLSWKVLVCCLCGGTRVAAELERLKYAVLRQG